MGKHFPAYLTITLSAAFYVGLSYFTPRIEAPQVLGFLALLFAGYALVLRWKAFPLQHWLAAGMFFRFICLFAFPNLSDDLYRFLWDGQLWIHGESPFLRVPAYHEHANFPIEGADGDLYGPMNSKEYFTIYPPVCQLIFAAAAWLFPTSIYGGTLTMKVFLLLAEVGNIWVIRKLLCHWNLPENRVLWYALNPLVIIEFSGNAHFEAIMIFFLFYSIYLLVTHRWIASAIVMALSICTKLLPLMLLPFFIKRLGWKRSFGYFTLIGLTSVILFIPFISLSLFANFKESFSLYFERFEFNASIFYLTRWVGYQVAGFNVIRTAGWSLSLVVLMAILVLAWREKGVTWKSLPSKILAALTIYFGMATIVHPWYVTTLVAVSVFPPWRYAMIWSATVTLSYYTYRDTTYTEQMELVAVEYLSVLGWLLYEVYRFRKNRQLTNEALTPSAEAVQ